MGLAQTQGQWHLDQPGTTSFKSPSLNPCHLHRRRIWRSSLEPMESQCLDITSIRGNSDPSHGTSILDFHFSKAEESNEGSPLRALWQNPPTISRTVPSRSQKTRTLYHHLVEVSHGPPVSMVFRFFETRVALTSTTTAIDFQRPSPPPRWKRVETVVCETACGNPMKSLGLI